MSNTFGKLFRVTTFGESHGKCVGVVVDGCPAGLELCESDIQPDLTRRRPGQSKITTQRDEKDKVEILSGVFLGKTTGSPIMMVVWNEDQQSKDYDNLKDIFRPSHADFGYDSKYGIRDHRGGGRSSARILIGRVAAGAIAKKILKLKNNMEFLAFSSQVGGICIPQDFDCASVTSDQIESNIIRCPHTPTALRMIELIEEVKNDQDSIGGCIKGLIKNCPVGIGEPEFDKLPAVLAFAMMGINATKGFEFGSGFGGVVLRGSEHNDKMIIGNASKNIINNSGGTLGGISNGNIIDFGVAIKPVATIAKSQITLNKNGEEVEYEAKGRHDPCVLPRAIPVIEAMSALVILDLMMANSNSRFYILSANN